MAKGVLLMKKFNLRFKLLATITLAVICALSIGVFTSYRVTAQGDQSEISQVIVNDTVRIQLLSDTLVRAEVKGPKGFEDRASYYVLNRNDWDKVNYTIDTEQEEGVTAIVTDVYTVYVPNNAINLNKVYIKENSTGEVLWNYMGETTGNVYLPSASDSLKCWYFSDSPRIIPSEFGYSDVQQNLELQGWDFDNQATDTFIFLPNGSYRQFAKDYTRLTGSAEMVTLRELGYWDSRWYAYSTETALQQIQDYLDQGYCIDVLVIDTDWRKNASIGYEINDALFPNMASFLEQAHQMGVNITFNDHPEPVKGTTNGLDQDEVNYRNENLTLLLSLGLDYWWYDRNWSVALNKFDSDVSVFAFGMYCYQWITKDYYESITDIYEYAERALIMANVDGCLHGKWNYASDISAHRYSIQWTGDIGSNSDALAQEIYASVFGGTEVGLPYMSSDIGGHTAKVTDDMYIRWTQYGALSTIYRVHCTNASYIGQVGRMPWLFGETAEKVAKEYVQIRYRLLPLYYNLAHEAYADGLPILRRLDINYPEYKEASNNDEYLLGDYILVAPIEEATIYEAVPSSWLSYDGDNGEVITGGLEAKYYTNNNWSGKAAVTQKDETIDFEWSTGGPSNIGLSDNYSVMWSGYVTIGEKDTCFEFYADDGIKVYIDGKLVVNGMDVYDTYLTTDFYKAGTTHSIQVYYCEYGGNAHVFMFYHEQVPSDESACLNTRDVFFPEGTWIDVWSGEKYVGPKTYTLTYDLETSPLFVREGSLVVLAENMQQTSEKDWHNVTLDVYPSKDFSANATLYEDDTTTVAYKDGHFRTTDVAMDYVADDNSLLLHINAAQGEFEGARAFDVRNWKIRVHAYEEWGAVTKMTVNGKEVKMLSFKKDSNASPFAYSGASLDSDIYEIEFSGNVYENCIVKVWFENMQETQVNEEYDTTALDFDLYTTEVSDVINLTEEGDIDWAYFGIGADDAITRMANGPALIEKPTAYDKYWRFFDYAGATSFTNGDSPETVVGQTCGIVSQKNFDLTINTVEGEAYYILYLSTYKCTAKVSVRDKAGNVKTVFFGNIKGNQATRVIVKCTSEEASKLYISYAMVSCVPDGTGSPSNVAMTSALVATKVAEIAKIEYAKVTAEIIEEKAVAGSYNLSDNGADLGVATLDWTLFGPVQSVKKVQKVNADYIKGASFNQNREFYDYRASLTWSDGEEVAKGSATSGFCSNGEISITFNVDENVGYIRVYTGCWRAKNTLYVYDSEDNILAVGTPFSAGDNSVCKYVTIKVDTDGLSKLKVVIDETEEYSDGNVSLTGVTVLGKQTV